MGREEREMSAIFDGYEREYCELSTQLARKTNMLGSLSGDSKSQKVSDINNDLSEAEALIRRMDLEARSLPPDRKGPLLSKLREYKADLSKLKSDAKKSSSKNSDLSNRAELGLVGDHWSASSAAQRERLLATTDRINRADDNITKSRKILSVMARRILQNKVIMFGIIAMLVGSIGMVIYFKFIRSSN